MDTEASQPEDIVFKNDITSGARGKVSASCICMEGYRRHRTQGVAGGVCVALVGVIGVVVGLCWYWLGPSDATCTGGTGVVECTGGVVDGMSPCQP